MMLSPQPKPILNIKPKELIYHPPFVGVISNQLLLQNTSTEHSLAYKVKTTAPVRYCVRPNTGIIPPGSSVEVLVLLNCSKDTPPFTMKSKDKFQIQSVVVTDDQIDPKEIWKNPPPSQTMKQKLKAVFSVQNVSNQHSSNSHSHTHNQHSNHISNNQSQQQQQQDNSNFSSSFSTINTQNSTMPIASEDNNSTFSNPPTTNIPDSIIINKEKKEREDKDDFNNTGVQQKKSPVPPLPLHSSSSLSPKLPTQPTIYQPSEPILKKRIITAAQQPHQESITPTQPSSSTPTSTTSSSSFINNSNNNIAELQIQVKKLTENIEKLEQEKKDLQLNSNSTSTTISSPSQTKNLIILFIIAIISFIFGKFF